MNIVFVDGDNIENALKIFKRAVAKDGILRQLKNRSRFESRGERRRRKDAESRRRKKRMVIKNERNEEWRSRRRPQA